MRLKGQVVGGDAYVFLELVDVDRNGRRVTVDDQTMPVRLKAGEVDKRVKLHGASWLLKPRHSLGWRSPRARLSTSPHAAAPTRST